MQENITAAILAGGPGSRMNGLIKPLMMIGGETIISRTLGVFSDNFTEIIIVTNNPCEYSEFPLCRMVLDQFTGIGPIGGIHAALKAASYDVVFICAGDTPLLNSRLIMRQINLFNSLRCDILVPKVGFSVEPLHAVYRRKVLTRLEEFLTSEKSNAVHEFFTMVDVKYMELDENEEIQYIFSNINVPSDIPAVERIIKRVRD